MPCDTGKLVDWFLCINTMYSTQYTFVVCYGCLICEVFVTVHSSMIHPAIIRLTDEHNCKHLFIETVDQCVHC